jgi:hypothetical protein
MLQIELSPGLPGGQWACLRALCGHDEAGIEGTSSIEATAFLDRLLVDMPGTSVGPGKAGNLAISDRDRLLAMIYMQCFGDRVESAVPCQVCDRSFDLHFSLSGLMDSLYNRQDVRATGPNEQGVYTMADGRQFRLPTSADQRWVLGLDPQQAINALLDRCIVKGDPQVDTETLQAAMDDVGPILDVDVEACCAECGTGQNVRFSMPSYLLRALAYEKRFLTREVHRIATVYGWGLQEILTLSRDDRRTYVRLIEADGITWKRPRL